jgi:histidinol-phosphate phosphatase family protein
VKQAVILAGGKGTRLRERLGDLPKPLVAVAGVPLLFRQLQALERAGWEEALVLVNHRAEAIEEFVARTPLAIRCRIINDGEPRGTAGAVLALGDLLADQFLVVYGDTLFDVDFERFLAFHRHSGLAGSLFLHPNDHPEDSDLVEIDDDARIVGFHPYPHPPGSWFPNLVNAALYILEKAPLREYRNLPPPLDFAKDLFPRMVADGHSLAGYVSSEYIKDLGTPSRLDKAEAALGRGAVERASYRCSQRAVFIDRDGTVNEERGFIRRAEDLAVFPSVGPALRLLNDAEYRTVLVTNQPVLARGETTPGELRRIHGRLDAEVALSKAFFDAKYVCPHHPDSGFAGEVKALKVPCGCRKPAPGLVLRAARDMNLDLKASWFIGDSTADFGAARQAGVRSVGVRTGEGGRDGRYPFAPDVVVDDFAAAVEYLLEAAHDH